MNLTPEEEVAHAMQFMTEKQKDFLLSVFRRLRDDYAFAIRFARERSIFISLMRAENYPSLERWLARRTVELVPRRDSNGDV